MRTVPDRYSHIVLILELKVSHVMSQKQRKGSVGVRLERCRLLDGNLLMSLSTALEVSPYIKQVGENVVHGALEGSWSIS